MKIAKMKKLTIITVLFLVSASVFSQPTEPSPTLTKQDYLLKSKKQKKAAWVCLGGGVAAGVIGVVWAASNWQSGGPDVMFVLGGASIVGSIPLFIASGRNKRKAMSMSFNFQRLPQLQNGAVVSQKIPSLSLKISL
jgi:hypothetical protein